MGTIWFGRPRRRYRSPIQHDRTGTGGSEENNHAAPEPLLRSGVLDNKLTGPITAGQPCNSETRLRNWALLFIQTGQHIMSTASTARLIVILVAAFLLADTALAQISITSSFYSAKAGNRETESEYEADDDGGFDERTPFLCGGIRFNLQKIQSH